MLPSPEESDKSDKSDNGYEDTYLSSSPLPTDTNTDRPSPPSVLNTDFQFVRDLRRGVGGIVSLYKYPGHDPKYKNLIPDGNENLIVVKRIPKGPSIDDVHYQQAKITFENEYVNVKECLSQNQPSDAELLRPRSYADIVDGEQIIFYECFFYDRNETRDLEQYMMSIGIQHAALNRVQYHVVNKTIAHFHQLFLGMHLAQQQLHDIGMLHLDTAARNLVVTKDSRIKLIDFGTSLPMDLNGSAQKKFDPPKKPSPIYNSVALTRKNSYNSPATSIYTEIYELKMTLIQCLAHYMGMSSYHARSIDNIDSNTWRDEIKECYSNSDNFYSQQPSLHSSYQRLDRATMTGKQRIENCLNCLTIFAEFLGNGIRNTVTIQLIRKYKNYLTSEHIQNGYWRSVQDQDFTKFTECQSSPKLSTLNAATFNCAPPPAARPTSPLIMTR